jgi:predicted house-cleaning noncanonical NTP pyrophosphatase (MazG superfamily)
MTNFGDDQDYRSVESTAPPRVIASWSDTSREFVFDVNFVGAKGVGLFRLPPGWVPPFVVLTKAFSELITQSGSVANALTSLTGADRTAFRDLLDSAQRSGSAIFVRSNSPHENLGDRGAYRSYTIEPDLRAIAEAIAAVFASTHAQMYVIVQVAIQPGLQGHMSNERRVTSQANRWLVEGLYGSDADLRQRFISASKFVVDVDELHASHEKELLSRLRTVASTLLQIGLGQYHCEWIWDGRRLWIVQCDDASIKLDNGRYANEYLLSSETLSGEYTAQEPILAFDQTSDIWSKLECPKTFKRLGLPPANICFISGSDWVDPDPIRHKKILDELRLICTQPTVVRCDVGKSAAKEDVLLPTSNESTDAADLAKFMDRCSEDFRATGLTPEEWAFLPARLVPARASAWAHAHPGAQYVRVDSLWGYPDGLLHYSHDTSFYYPEDRRVDPHARHKGQCVLSEQTGWRTLPIKAPLDWRQVLSEDEVQTVAEWALRLANGLGQEIQLMSLAHIGGQRGPNGCLPWHYTAVKVPPYDKGLRARPSGGGIEVVKNRSDLERLRQGRGSDTIRGYQIMPVSDLLRNYGFLTEVATFAAEQKKPMYFEGSLLPHAYYVMSKTGASIIPVIDEPGRHVKVYQKLVRDFIPIIIRQAGGLARVRVVPRSEARALLLQKLIEEAFEARSASASNIVEELADILDVIEALEANFEIEAKSLASVREKKRARRGGFDHLILLEETDILPLKMTTQPQGHLPLFGAEPSLPSKKRSTAKPDSLRVEQSTDQRELIRLSLSLVPPVGNKVAATITVHVGDHEIGNYDRTIKVDADYRGSRVVLRIVRGDESKTDDDNQLVLPLVAEEGLEEDANDKKVR